LIFFVAIQWVNVPICNIGAIFLIGKHQFVVTDIQRGDVSTLPALIATNEVADSKGGGGDASERGGSISPRGGERRGSAAKRASAPSVSLTELVGDADELLSALASLEKSADLIRYTCTRLS
jgi:hypothetical protein